MYEKTDKLEEYHLNLEKINALLSSLRNNYFMHNEEVFEKGSEEAQSKAKWDLCNRYSEWSYLFEIVWDKAFDLQKGMEKLIDEIYEEKRQEFRVEKMEVAA